MLTKEEVENALSNAEILVARKHINGWVVGLEYLVISGEYLVYSRELGARENKTEILTLFQHKAIKLFNDTVDSITGTK